MQNLNWVESCIVFSGTYNKISLEELNKFENYMYDNTRSGHVLIAPVGRVLVQKDGFAAANEYSAFSLMCYISGHFNLANDVLAHGEYGCRMATPFGLKFNNMFNQNCPGMFDPRGWVGKYPYIMVALQTAAQSMPSKLLRALTVISYLLAFPNEKRIDKEFKRWLSAQVLYLHFPVIRWSIDKYIQRMARQWVSPERMLSKYYNDPVHPVVLSWKGKGWTFVEKEV